MKHGIRDFSIFSASLALLALAQPAGAADHPYSEGPVSVYTSVRTADGHFDEYMSWLAGPWKKFMEAQKQAGIILGYHVYQGFPRNLNEPDLYLEITYKNLGAMDNLDAKVDPISEKIMGPTDKATADMVARGKMRTVLGDEMVRELTLK